MSMKSDRFCEYLSRSQSLSNIDVPRLVSGRIVIGGWKDLER